MANTELVYWALSSGGCVKAGGLLGIKHFCFVRCDGPMYSNLQRRDDVVSFMQYYLLSLFHQFCNWYEDWAARGREEALASISVDHPRQENIQRAAAFKAHETWKRKTCLFLSLKAALYCAARWQWFYISLQVIGLLDVFSPASCLKEFNDV